MPAAAPVVGRLSAEGAGWPGVRRGSRGVCNRREEPKLRDRYGRNIHGQCLLLARRLVEAGVGLVTVNWHDDGQNFWDTHGDNFQPAQEPPDAPGRPGILRASRRPEQSRPARRDAGRLGGRVRPHAADHQANSGPRALAALLLGRPGRGRASAAVIFMARPTAGPPIPSATRSAPTTWARRSLHALGIDPGTMVKDAVDRPLKINDGTPLVPLFA